MQQRIGQTLIEVLLAITVIVIGIVSLVSALISIQASASNSLAEAVAMQLGREAIEAARFVRDSNWLERENGLGSQFTDGLNSSTEANDYTAVYTWNPSQTDPNLAVMFDFTADSSTATQTKVYRNLAGLYRQFSSTPGASWQATSYSRYVTLYPICSSDGGITEQVVTADTLDCSSEYAGTTQIGVQVEVTIQWSSRNDNHTRILEERLYDWRYAKS